ncbi:MAG: xanthine dehydrogenase family protein [Elusimicrobia bacterium]|nr:xanthine dehydrogenase family protein [Elusimicrobiota bacterium]
MGVVGTNPRRREGPEKVCGTARYIDDEPIQGCLHGVTLRSSVPCGRVASIAFDPAFPWDECVVARASDIPGKNYVALIHDDQPLLNEAAIRHLHEPILLIAHASRPRAYQALAHVKVAYEPAEPVYDVREALRSRVPMHGTDNVFKDILIEKGSLAEGFDEAFRVVEGEYAVPHQEQAYIENNGLAARVESDGTVVVRGSMQCPYYIHKALKVLFALPDAKVRVVQTTTGGGFGGKEEYPSMLAGHAALLALKSGWPVKMIYDRHEDMAATTKRHPAIVRHRTAVAKDGRLLAQDVEVVMDGGAYMTLSPVVLSRGALHATGPYECPNVRVRARAVATNTPPNGAFRGFGAPQTLFAAELQMDRVAAALGLDPVALRRRNLLREGSVTHTGQTLRRSVGTEEVLDRTLKASGWAAKRRAYARWNRDARKPTWRGLGLALVHHGAGFTGSGEVYLASEAGVALTRDGRLRVLAANTEIGQGTNTVFAQIVADALGVPFADVEVAVPDTAEVPNSGPTVASRTCMIVGGLVARAAARLKAAVRESGGSLRGLPARRRAAAKLCGGAAQRAFIAKYEKPGDVVWDEAAYRGDAYAVYSYGCVVADVEIDRLTFEPRVRALFTAQDIGRAIHPLLAEGQIIGGIAQGLGYALHENVVMKDGGMLNASLTNYIIPTSVDTPRMKVEIVERPFEGGPFGAKGLGELPMDSPGPAVANAVAFALRRWPDRLPVLPETVLALLARPEAGS